MLFWGPSRIGGGPCAGAGVRVSLSTLAPRSVLRSTRLDLIAGRVGRARASSAHGARYRAAPALVRPVAARSCASAVT